jgi:acyl-CoA thioesterase I
MIRMDRKLAGPLALCLSVATAVLACGAPAADAPTDAARSAADSGMDGAAADSSRTTSASDERATVLFVGTSLTAGLGVGEDVAFPARIQAKIDSAGLPFTVVNAGISGETSAGGLARLDWMLQQPIDVLVLELGANDGLRGYDVDAMRANLDTILTRTRARYPEAALVIAGMEAPPNLGARYTERFRDTFRDLARKHDAALVPFLLEGVAGEAAFNQEDRIHPSAEGHEVIARNVWEVLRPVLERPDLR